MNKRRPDDLEIQVAHDLFLVREDEVKKVTAISMTNFGLLIKDEDDRWGRSLKTYQSQGFVLQEGMPSRNELEVIALRRAYYHLLDAHEALAKINSPLCRRKMDDIRIIIGEWTK